MFVRLLVFLYFNVKQFFTHVCKQIVNMLCSQCLSEDVNENRTAVSDDNFFKMLDLQGGLLQK